MAIIGYILQRSIIQGAISRGELTTLIVTFGLSIIIENGLQQFFTANSRGLGVGDLFITASFTVGSQITIAYLNLGIFVLAVIVLLGLNQYLSASKYGRRSAPSPTTGRRRSSPAPTTGTCSASRPRSPSAPWRSPASARG